MSTNTTPIPAPGITLSELAVVTGGTLSDGAANGSVAESVSMSSKLCEAGSLYVAIPGTKFDGHDFLDDAFERGAVAAVVTNPEKLGSRPGIVVTDARLAVSQIAARFSRDPSKQLAMVGITGTNGKTTIHWVVYHLLERLGVPSARIGTIGFQFPGGADVSSLTSPDPILTQMLLRRAVDAGARAATMECSSHGLDQKRMESVQFDVGVFTNLTRDHLDYHHNMESYYEAKLRLVSLVASSTKSTRAAVINTDDNYGKRMAEFARDAGLLVLGYGMEDTELRIERFAQNISGSTFVIDLPTGKLPGAGPNPPPVTIRSAFIGIHNAYNLAAAFGAVVALGYEPEKVAALFPDIPVVPGRLEPVGDDKIGVYVDYAHTPDALANVLRALRPLSEGALWVIFGCGGDRDRGKRPEMAKIARDLADKVVVTSDNPRTETPQSIIDEILSGGIIADIVEIDRRRAIELTLAQTASGDVVLVAGKGHEDYQIIGTEKFHFSDQEEVRRVLKSM